jgi:TPR repeat protein
MKFPAGLMLVLLGFILISCPRPAQADALADGIEAAQQKDYTAALKLLQPLADKGDAVAEYNIGVLYEKGWGLDKSPAEAEKWYRKAADQGSIGASTRLLHGPPPRTGLAAPPLQILILAMTAFCLLGTASLAKILAPAVTVGKIRPSRAAQDIEKLASPEQFYAELKHHLFFLGLLLVGALSGLFELALTFGHR